MKATLAMSYFRSHSEIYTQIYNNNYKLHLTISVWYVSRAFGKIQTALMAKNVQMHAGGNVFFGPGSVSYLLALYH